MNVAFIPVRGGSKSIPLKNIKIIAGHPLVYWTVRAANECSYIDEVYISTDCEEIKDVVNGFGFSKVKVIERSPESATDTASTEFAMLEFAKKNMFENVVLIQATSPLLTSKDLNGGFELYNTEGTDSVLSVVRQKRFIWDITENKIAVPLNYDVFNRPRRQEFKGYLVENGAFYITNRDKLLQSKNRVSGNIKAYEMDELTYFEIDEPSDWVIIEKQLESKNKKINNVPEIKMFITDCDGCLTDGGMYYSENGDELKKFNTRDGVGISLLKEKGMITVLITGEDINLVSRRCNKIKIDEVYMGIKNKKKVVIELSKKYGIPLNHIAYFGDDLNDLESMKICGYTGCPNDANKTVKSLSDYICDKNGGFGAVREFIDHILDL